MKCSICGGALTVNNKGEITCPQCSKLKRKLKLTQCNYNDFIYYKVKDTLNLVVDEYLLPDEVNKYVNQGVEVTIK